MLPAPVTTPASEPDDAILGRGRQCVVRCDSAERPWERWRVIPYRNVHRLEDLTDAEAAEMMSLARLCARVGRARAARSASSLRVSFHEPPGDAPESSVELQLDFELCGTDVASGKNGPPENSATPATDWTQFRSEFRRQLAEAVGSLS